MQKLYHAVWISLTMTSNVALILHYMCLSFIKPLILTSYGFVDFTVDHDADNEMHELLTTPTPATFNHCSGSESQYFYAYPFVGSSDP